MKLVFGILMTAMLIIACSSAQPTSMHPDIAKIPELEFFYWKNNAWTRVRGHGGDYFQIGDAKKFKIKSNSHGGDCTINYQDGDKQNTYSCDPSGETVLDLGNYYVNNPPVVGISVAMKNLGNQVGFLYADMDSPRDVLPVDFKCPYQGATGNNSVCTRPATYPFNMSVHIPAGVGQLQYIYKCDGSTLSSQIYNVNGPSIMNLQMNQSVPDYCFVSLSYKSDSIAQQQLIHIRFYDNQYLPLGLPVVTKIKGGFQFCAGDNYDAYTINGVQHGSLSKGGCDTIQATSLDFMAWDSIGRITWAEQDALMVQALVGYRFSELDN